MSFNLKITRQDFDDIASASGLDPVDFDIAYADAKEHIKVSTDSKKHQYSSTNSAKRLFDKWYRSVKKGNPDYEGVYGDPSYITDIWACWKMYSRDSVNVLNSPKSMNGISVVEYIMNEIGHIDTVVDAGCGFAYTTGLLKEIFPVDVIFASEYFEHFYEPIAHLKDVLDNCSPKFLITANGFGGDAIGHFDDYRVDEDLDDSDNKWDLFSGEDVKGGNIQSSKETSKRFNQYLKDRGYTKLDTKIWNSRPAVWQKGPIITSMSAKFEKLFD